MVSYDAAVLRNLGWKTKERGDFLMPLVIAETGKPCTVVKVGGKAETKKFLETLGFVPGAVVTIVNTAQGNIIANVKESRVAISKEIAAKIMIH